jgi:hypothetical protein
LLGTLEVRAWGRTVIGRGFGAHAAGLGGVFSWGYLACCVLTCFTCAFAAVAAVAVTRAAFAALTVFGGAGAIGCGVAVGWIVCTQARFRRAGIGGLAWAALWALATFTSAFISAFATFAATITAFAWGALCAHFAAFGGQLGLGIAAAFAQVLGELAFGRVVTAWARAAITAAFTGRSITIWALAAFTAFTTFRALTALRALTAFSALTAWGAGFAFAAFDAAFTTASTFAWRADFAGRAFAALASATIAASTAAITA